MPSQNQSNIEPEQHKLSTPMAAFPNDIGSAGIQQELNRLEEMILSSPHIPLTRRTIVDEEHLLDQLDVVRLHLPEVLQAAQAIVEQKQAIILQAEQQAEEIIRAAQAQAAQIINETAIMRQAELAAKQLQQTVQQECIAAQEQNLIEIDQMHQQAQQELEEMRQRAIAEAEEIQQGADEYADAVLNNLEQQLKDILRIIYNGRQQLKSDVPPNRNSTSNSNKSSIVSTN